MLLPFITVAQSITVSGKVEAGDVSPIGVNVVEKGMVNGTTTDIGLLYHYGRSRGHKAFFTVGVFDGD